MSQADSLRPGQTSRSLEVDGRTRSYLLYAPSSYDGGKAVPVVLAFHGGGSNAEQMVGFTGLNDVANKEGFLVIYPNGTGRAESYLTFNSGDCCGYAQRQKIDDVKFVAAVLDDLEKIANVDSNRVYATGMSNGALLTYLLASELSDRIAAIAPVAGPMGTATCRPKRPVSVIHFHGTKDQFAPLEGGVGKRSLSRMNFRSVQHGIDAWVKANECPAEPKEEKLADKADDGMRVVRKTYGSGKEGAEVVLVTIEGGGHTWPGRVPKLAFLGSSTLDISANEMMWEFFKRHPRKG